MHIVPTNKQPLPCFLTEADLTNMPHVGGGVKEASKARRRFWAFLLQDRSPRTFHPLFPSQFVLV
jgi:hypothetical protein